MWYGCYECFSRDLKINYLHNVGIEDAMQMCLLLHCSGIICVIDCFDGSGRIRGKLMIECDHADS